MTQRDLLPDEVDVKLDMFCPPMMNRVGGEVGGGDVFPEDDSGLVDDGAVKLLEKLT
jgi:hypothetical protein